MKNIKKQFCVTLLLLIPLYSLAGSDEVEQEFV